ncbi:MAG: SCO family protein [Candidatus Dadabacteria bacterium]|nr:SCO family protein [Candidatus Dadabacteria bacterium]MYC40833.1 SCO family protein [Candidatus Dadabacteria bacterium]
MKRYYLPLAALVLIALVWFAVLGFLRTDKTKFYGDEYRRPAFDFSLTDQRNQKFILSEHADKVILLNFGFTNCPDVCPTTLGILGEVLDIVGDDRAMALFVTVDPERDTAERLGAYIPFFHDRIVGLTGSEEKIKQVNDACGTFYSKEQEISEEDYMVVHSPAVYLIGPGGAMLLRYPKEKLLPEKMADDVKRLLL